MGGWLFALLAYVGAPIFLARKVARADWKEVTNAYCILWSVLLLFGIASGGTIGEKFGWPLIFGMFLSTPGIPIIVVISRRLGLRLPWFA